LPLRSPLNERNSAAGGHGGRASRRADNPALYCIWPEPLNAADMARRVVCAWPTEADAATFRAPGGNRKKAWMAVYWMMFHVVGIAHSPVLRTPPRGGGLLGQPREYLIDICSGFCSIVATHHLHGNISSNGYENDCRRVPLEPADPEDVPFSSSCTIPKSGRSGDRPYRFASVVPASEGRPHTIVN